MVYNKHSWNSHSNILFLGQPVNVGYSYSDGGSQVDRSAAAGEDQYAFFQLFFNRFPEYSKAPFHMAAESYGGTYAPNAAAIFHGRNKQLALSPVSDIIKFNLAPVILANGLILTSKWLRFQIGPVRDLILCMMILMVRNVWL